MRRRSAARPETSRATRRRRRCPELRHRPLRGHDEDLPVVVPIRVEDDAPTVGDHDGSFVPAPDTRRQPSLASTTTISPFTERAIRRPSGEVRAHGGRLEQEPWWLPVALIVYRNSVPYIVVAHEHDFPSVG